MNNVNETTDDMEEWLKNDILGRIFKNKSDRNNEILNKKNFIGFKSDGSPVFFAPDSKEKYPPLPPAQDLLKERGPGWAWKQMEQEWEPEAEDSQIL